MLRVGAPIWANRDWVGPYFPKDTASGRELAAYAQWCNAVEGNTTFYSEPSAEAVAAWLDGTPDDFRFFFKLPKEITHDRRLRGGEEKLGQFLSKIEPLGDRLGPILIQLPGSFGPDSLHALRSFLATCPTEVSWSVEVRNRGFFVGDDERALNDTLFEAGADRTIFDSRALFAAPPVTPPEIDAHRKKPNNPVRAVALHENPVVRFVAGSDPIASVSFWEPWVAKVADWIVDGREPYFFVHTPDNFLSLELARRFHEEVFERVGDRANFDPLPQPPKTDQQDLFE